MLRLSLLFFLCAMTYTAIGQVQYCGMKLTAEEQVKRDAWLADRQLVPRSNMMTQVALSLHIAKDQSGNGAISEALVLNEIRKVNKSFEPMNLEFVVCGGIRYIEDADFFDLDLAQARQLNGPNHIRNTLNIYFTRNLFYKEGEREFYLCGISSFPWEPSTFDRYMVMASGCSSDGSTLIHELGHFYGLLHTHETAGGTEFVDGTNCRNSGDYICDTPADPQLGSDNVEFRNGECVYTGRMFDPRGVLYRPDPTNFMSYSPARCAQNFTQGQYDVMDDILRVENSYLLANCSLPDFEMSSVTDIAAAKSGENTDLNLTITNLGQFDGRFINLEIYFSDRPDRDGDLLYEEEISAGTLSDGITKTLDIPVPTTLTSGSYYLYAIIDSEDNIHELDESNNLFTWTLTIDNSSIPDMVLMPNVMSRGESTNIFLRNSYSGLMDLDLFDMSGRRVRSWQVRKIGPELFEQLDMSNVQMPGVYQLLVTWGEEGKNILRLVRH